MILVNNLFLVKAIIGFSYLLKTPEPPEQHHRLISRGGSRIFFRREWTLFFWQNTSCIRKPEVISEYNENTTVKDLQRRAKTGRHKRNANGCSRKECVTKRLWFILQVFCRIDKKKGTPGKNLQRVAFSELKNGCSIKECATQHLWHILPVCYSVLCKRNEKYV